MFRNTFDTSLEKDCGRSFLGKGRELEILEFEDASVPITEVSHGNKHSDPTIDKTTC